MIDTNPTVPTIDKITSFLLTIYFEIPGNVSSVINRNCSFLIELFSKSVILIYGCLVFIKVKSLPFGNLFPPFIVTNSLSLILFHPLAFGKLFITHRL